MPRWCSTGSASAGKQRILHDKILTEEVFCLAMRITFNRLPNELSERFEFRLSFY